jgi:hypothetical protein
VCGLVGTPIEADQGPWVEALLGFAQVDENGKLDNFPATLPPVETPPGEAWERLAVRMNKLSKLLRQR